MAAVTPGGGQPQRCSGAMSDTERAAARLAFTQALMQRGYMPDEEAQSLFQSLYGITRGAEWDASEGGAEEMGPGRNGRCETAAALFESPRREKGGGALTRMYGSEIASLRETSRVVPRRGTWAVRRCPS